MSLFGLTHSQWATESGLTENAYSTNDHALFALATLTSTNLNVNDMMFSYLRDTKLLTGSLADMVETWDGTFSAVAQDNILLESGDAILLEDGTNLILE